MPTDAEIAAWLDLAEFARGLTDTVSDEHSKRTMRGIAGLCEAMAFRESDQPTEKPAMSNVVRWDAPHLVVVAST